MGIADLWDVLKPGIDERLPFDTFVSQFIEQHGRTPRIAIDGYMFIFQSTHSSIAIENETPTLIRNFMSKLLYLTSLNVSYVVVFDGALKPDKLRNGGEAGNGYNYDEVLARFLRLSPENYKENSALIEYIKSKLISNRIDFVEAPGEAEAECACLQRYGIVDYVISNDVDTLVFGAEKVLRNFSKHIEDVGSSPKKNTGSSTRYFVTPVHMSRIEERTGMNSQRLVLIATLRGGDYSAGISKIGIKNASKLALCGTAFASDTRQSSTKKYNNRSISVLPDFSKELVKCFVKEENKSIFGWDSIKDPATRSLELRRFIHLLNKELRLRSRQIFGRLLTLNTELFIDEYYTLVYLFPLVNYKLYKFIPSSLSCGDFAINESDLKVPSNNFVGMDKFATDNVVRINNLLEYCQKDLGLSKFSYSESTDRSLYIVNQTFEPFQELTHSRTTLIIPNSYEFSIKHIIIRLLSHISSSDTELSEFIELTGHKIEDGYELLMVKFDSVRISTIMMLNTRDIQKIRDEESTYIGEESVSPPRSPSRSPSMRLPAMSPSKSSDRKYFSKPKLDHVWLPRNLIFLVNADMVRRYDLKVMEANQRKKISSPRKNQSVQKTTLDVLGYFPKSPRKRESISCEAETMSKASFNTSPSKNQSNSLKKTSPKKKSNVQQSLLRQKSIDLFLNKDINKDNPFVDHAMELFLSEEDTAKDHPSEGLKASYSSMKKSFASKPILQFSKLSHVPSGSNIIPKRKATSPVEYRFVKRTRESVMSSDSAPLKAHAMDSTIPSSAGYDQMSPIRKIVTDQPTKSDHSVIIIDSENESSQDTSSIMEIFPERS